MVKILGYFFLLMGPIWAIDEEIFWSMPANQAPSFTLNYTEQNLGEQTRVVEQLAYSKPWHAQEIGIALERENTGNTPHLRLAHLGFGRAQVALSPQIKDASYELNQNGADWALWQGLYYKQRSMLTEKNWLDSTAEYQTLLGAQWSPLSKLALHTGFSVQELEGEFAPNAHTLLSLNTGVTCYLFGNNKGVLLPISPAFLQPTWKQQGLSIENSYEHRFWQGAQEYNFTHALRSEWQKEHLGLGLHSYIFHHFQVENLWWGNEINLNLRWNSWSTEFYFAQNRPLFQTRSQGWNLHFQYKKLFF